jgi:hypothetical protein
MSKSNTTETDVLGYIFNATAFSWNANSNLYVSLHTADPGETGDQSTSEATYTGHNRPTVARSGAGWTVVGNTASNAALIQFAQCTGGSNVITHVAIGTAASGTGQILYSGSLNSPLTISNLIQPQFSAGALQIVED